LLSSTQLTLLRLLAITPHVKRILPVAIALTFAGVSCIIAGYFCHFYYTLYRHASTDLEQTVDSRIKQLHWDVERLAKQRHFRPIRARLFISTTDQQFVEWLGAGTSPGQYQLGQSKMGWIIQPELRLPAGSTALQEFKINLWPPGTRAMDAWISPPGQPEAVAAFETFTVHPDEGTNSLTLTVRAKPGVSVKHEFTVVVLRDSNDGQQSD
jgi:hypothetical protein